MFFYKYFISSFITTFHLRLAKASYTLLGIATIENWFTNDLFDSNKWWYDTKLVIGYLTLREGSTSNVGLDITLLWHYGNCLLDGLGYGSETSLINSWFGVFVSDSNFKDSTIVKGVFMFAIFEWLLPFRLFEVIPFSSKILVSCSFNVLISWLIDSENLLSTKIWWLS